MTQVRFDGYGLSIERNVSLDTPQHHNDENVKPSWQDVNDCSTIAHLIIGLLQRNIRVMLAIPIRLI